MVKFIAGVDSLGHIIDKPLPFASEEQVVAFEAFIKTRLPDDYRKFLKTVNGGMVDPSQSESVCFQVQWEGRPKCETSIESLGYLNSLGNGEHIDVESRTRLWFSSIGDSEAFAFPGVIPIGHDGGFGTIVIGIGDDDNRGRIYFVLDTGHADFSFDRPRYNIGFVANSFHEFLAALRPCLSNRS